MAKRKKNRQANPLYQQNREKNLQPKRKFFTIGRVAAAAGLVGLCAIAHSFFSQAKREIPPHSESFNEQPTIKEAWDARYHEGGKFINRDYLLQFPLLQEIEKISSLPEEEKSIALEAILQPREKEYPRFLEDAIPENYTDAVFYKAFMSAYSNDELFLPREVSGIFGLEQHPLFRELKATLPSGEERLFLKILSCAVLMAQQKMEYELVEKGETKKDFLQRITQGRGDCSEYTYAAANLYYTICMFLGKYELEEKIRVVLGMRVDEGGKIVGRHSWLQFFEKEKWRNLEISSYDKITPETPVTLQTPCLTRFEAKTGAYLPLITTIVKFDPEKRINLSYHFSHYQPHVLQTQ
ncbi:hypothetical protein HYU14_01870 [Candidatus Woesearchaeota archaeon]|nr:hypothetical protein [Candidatus Woesearchaeota archaeon]